jgi:ribosome-associated protein
MKKAAKKVAKQAIKKVDRKAVKKVVKKVAKKAARKAVKQPVKKVVKKPAQKSMRGVSGAKAARIAQIVAESFLPKPAPAPAPESRPATVETAPAAPDEALATAHMAAAVLFSKKAEDVVLMDLRNLSTVADYYLIATCQNEPQMRAMLGTVQRTLSRGGVKSLRAEYMPGVRWAVIDYGDLILHLFERQTRGYYSLERLWADAPSTGLKAEDYSLPHDPGADEDGDL